MEVETLMDWMMIQITAEQCFNFTCVAWVGGGVCMRNNPDARSAPTHLAIFTAAYLTFAT